MLDIAAGPPSRNVSPAHIGSEAGPLATADTDDSARGLTYGRSTMSAALVKNFSPKPQ